MPPEYFDKANAPLVLIYYETLFDTLPDYSFMRTKIDSNNFYNNQHVQNNLLESAVY